MAEGGQDPDPEGRHSWVYSSPLLCPEAVACCRRAPLHHVMGVSVCEGVALFGTG